MNLLPDLSLNSAVVPITFASPSGRKRDRCLARYFEDEAAGGRL
jgi:hypothetical protein